MHSSAKEWSDSNHSLNYLKKADSFPHRKDGEAVLLDNIPLNAKRILDIGAGSGRLIKQIKEKENFLSNVEFVALDVSPTMIKALKHEFDNDNFVKIVEHDLDNRLPDLGYFDAIISSFAIHHLKHHRKYSLYEEIYDILNSGGIFSNMEHVISASVRQHNKFIESIGVTSANEDKTNRLLSVEKQLHILSDIGFIEVDCYWKWYEMALLICFKI